MRYHAKSLEDVAKAFDDFADRARNNANDPRTSKKHANLCLREWAVWLSAADFIRNTKLED